MLLYCERPFLVDGFRQKKLGNIFRRGRNEHFPESLFHKKRTAFGVFLTPNEVIFKGAVGTLIPKILQHCRYIVKAHAQ